MKPKTIRPLPVPTSIAVHSATVEEVDENSKTVDKKMVALVIETPVGKNTYFVEPVHARMIAGGLLDVSDEAEDRETPALG